MDEDSDDAIACLLAETWEFHKREEFALYIARTFRVAPPVRPVFDRMYISEARRGDFETAALYHAVRWWQVDDAGLREACECDLAGRPNRPSDEREGLHATPTLRFFSSGDDVLIGEFFGHGLHARKHAKLALVDGRLAFTDVRVLKTF